MSDIKIWDVNECGIIYEYPDGCFEEKQEGEVVLKSDHLKAIEEKDKDAALIVKIHDGSVKNLCSKINKLDAIIAKQAKEIERLKELTK